MPYSLCVVAVYIPAMRKDVYVSWGQILCRSRTECKANGSGCYSRRSPPGWHVSPNNAELGLDIGSCSCRSNALSSRCHNILAVEDKCIAFCRKCSSRESHAPVAVGLDRVGLRVNLSSVQFRARPPAGTLRRGSTRWLVGRLDRRMARSGLAEVDGTRWLPARWRVYDMAGHQIVRATLCI